MEQTPLFDRYNAGIDWGVTGQPQNPNWQVVSASLETMECPSDPNSRNPNLGSATDASQPPRPSSGAWTGWDRGNYGFNYGGGFANENDTGENGFPGKPNWSTAGNRGMFSSRVDPCCTRYSARFADIIDGTANTLLAAEIVTENNAGDCRGCWGLNMGAIVSAYTVTAPSGGPGGIVTPNAPAEDQSGGATGFRDCPTYCGSGAGSRKLRCSDCGGDGSGGVGARSYHPGGAMVVRADGSVNFASETVDRVLWRGLFTTQGGDQAIPTN
jgi:hypothetical protein